MAIAYYIPDQSKLAQKASHQAPTTTHISIPLHYGSRWELIASIVCQALRLSNQTTADGHVHISFVSNHHKPDVNSK